MTHSRNDPLPAENKCRTVTLKHSNRGAAMPAILALGIFIGASLALASPLGSRMGSPGPRHIVEAGPAPAPEGGSGEAATGSCHPAVRTLAVGNQGHAQAIDAVLESCERNPNEEGNAGQASQPGGNGGVGGPEGHDDGGGPPDQSDEPGDDGSEPGDDGSEEGEPGNDGSEEGEPGNDGTEEGEPGDDGEGEPGDDGSEDGEAGDDGSEEGEPGDDGSEDHGNSGQGDHDPNGNAYGHFDGKGNNG